MPQYQAFFGNICLAGLNMVFSKHTMRERILNIVMIFL